MLLFKTFRTRKNSIQPQQITLTSSDVEKNIDQNGIWANKNFLTSQDLINYQAIAYNAFDTINKKLEYIEIDNTKKITNENNQKINKSKLDLFLKWDNIEQIKIKQISDAKEKYFIEKTGLIYYQIDEFLLNPIYIPIALSSKSKMIDITFPNLNDNSFPAFSSVQIPNNFYQTFNFKNTIKSIHFSPLESKDLLTAPTLVNKIGKNAFQNCQLLDKNLYLKMSSPNWLLEVSIDESAFENTNIQSVYILSDYFEVSLSNKSFYKNKNLKNVLLIYYYGTSLSIGDNCFSDPHQDFAFYLVPEFLKWKNPIINSQAQNLLRNFEIKFGENVFSNNQQYSKFNLFVKLSEDNVNKLNLKFKPHSLSNISLLNSENFKFNFYYHENELNDNLKQQLLNSGIQQQFLQKIKILPYNSESEKEIYSQRIEPYNVGKITLIEAVWKLIYALLFIIYSPLALS